MRSAHRENMKLWRAGSAVPSLSRPLASLSFKGLSLEGLAAVTADLPEEVVCLGTQTNTQFLEALQYHNMPPEVSSAVYKCSRLFRMLIKRETGQIPKVGVQLGPYQVYPAAREWHRDAATDVDCGHIVYTFTLLGPPTVFCTNEYGKDDFNGKALKKEVQPAGPEVFTYGTGIVAAHDGMTTAHRAPDLAHQGMPRIFLSSTVCYVLADHSGHLTC